jgi:chromosome segregation ATPase
MPPSLPTRLLALAAAVAADGGEAVRRTLRDLVAEAAPFDDGEIVHRGEDGLTRWGLGPGAEGGLAAEDLLAGLWSVAAPLRFDDRAEMASFPATRALLAERGLRSLLALPLPSGGAGGEAALLIAHRQGWGFAAASLPALQPMAAVAGAALARSLAMTSLQRRVEALEAGLSAGGTDRTALRRELLAAREERDRLRGDLDLLRGRLAAEEAKSREAEALLHELEAARDGLQAEAVARDEKAARATMERDVLARELEATAAARSAAEERLEAARAEVAQTEASAAAATAERDAMAAARREQELKVAELEVRVEELGESRDALRAELDRTRGDLQQREAELQLLRGEIRLLREEVVEARTLSVTGASAEAFADQERRREHVAWLESEKDGLQRALSAARDEAARARAAEGEARAAEAEARASHAAAEAGAAALERSLRQAEADREALRAEIRRRDEAPSSSAASARRRPRAARKPPPPSRVRARPRGPKPRGAAQKGSRIRPPGRAPGRAGRR